jgi:hypothetical protein
MPHYSTILWLVKQVTDCDTNSYHYLPDGLDQYLIHAFFKVIVVIMLEAERKQPINNNQRSGMSLNRTV